MNKKRQKQIEEIAVTILQKTNCYPAEIEELKGGVGINVKKVVKAMNIALKEYDFGDDVSGVLLIDNKKVTIGYTNKNRPPRQRFTIAHELGHYILGHQKQSIFIDTPEKYFTLFRNAYSTTGEDPQEREANAFAASLLMPRNLVIKVAISFYQEGISKNEDFDLVDKLATRFNVSKLAMSIRLTNLDLLW